MTQIKIHRFIRTSIVLFALLGLFSQRGLAQKDGEDVIIGKYRVLHSKVFNEDRLLVVHLPRGYESDKISYPVLYHLYGDNIVDYIAPAMIACDKLGETAEAPPMIIVGVANTDRYRDNHAFNADGSAGGADRFIRFFKEELFPFIDQNYRTKSFRILAGPQAGAHFSLYTLMTSPELFDVSIATNPFEGDERVASWLLGKAEESFAKTTSLKKFFYFTCEEDERAAALEQARRLFALVESRKIENLDFRMVINKPSGFFITPVPVLEALRAYFAGFRLPAGFQPESLDGVKAYYEKLSAKYGFAVEPPELTLTFAGDHLSEQGKVQEARKLFQYQLDLYPASLNAFWRLGELSRSQGDFAEARDYYKAFLSIQPQDAAMVRERLSQVERIINGSAAYRIEQEISKGGIKAGLKKYRELMGDEKSGLYFDENEFNAMGYRLMNKGMLKESVEVLKLNVELHPNSANVYDSLGEAYMKIGKSKLALKNYQKSLELNSKNENARLMIQRIKALILL